MFASRTARLENFRKAFVKRCGLRPPIPDEELHEKLPRTVEWLREAAMSSLRPVQRAPDAPGRPSRCTLGPELELRQQRPEEVKMGAVKWGTVGLGILANVSSSEAASEEQLPETLSLNVARSGGCQINFQSIVVVATGLLLLRRELTSEVPGVEAEKIVSQAH